MGLKQYISDLYDEIMLILEFLDFSIDMLAALNDDQVALMLSGMGSASIDVFRMVRN